MPENSHSWELDPATMVTDDLIGEMISLGRNPKTGGGQQKSDAVMRSEVAQYRPDISQDGDAQG